MRIFTLQHAGILLSLCSLVHITIATQPDLVRRQETSLSTTNRPIPTSARNEDAASSASATGDATESSTVASSSLSTLSSPMSPTATSSLDIALFSDPIHEGELPLGPVITPGSAVAGVILVIAGLVYALVGIKTKWLHTYFSTAFLTSLGTTVLIVYVMIPPVSNGIQGAYVVAVVCTGAILGVLAVTFKEVTECLACLLGGFCLSMWLLALQPGGLIQNTGGKVGFIAAFALAAFCLYFTKWTRTYGLIACISFSGATVAVLGIDCFSRAGLKEFWAYLWALNDNLFPLGVNTYPLTRGIRVELAITILIFLAGIVSQLKLWRIIKERRDKRDAELAEGERNLRIEEEAVGRQVEEMTSRERQEWERVYGDGSASQPGDSGDLGVGDMESEKRARHSNRASVTVATRPQSANGTEESQPESPAGRAATPLSLTKALAAAEAMSRSQNDSRVTIRVAEDDVPETPQIDNRQGGEGSDVAGKETRRDSSTLSTSRCDSKHLPQIPVIVPLPFKIPESRCDDDRSSVATFADEDDTDPQTQKRNSRVEALARRLSNGSAKLFRTLSQRSARGKAEKEAAGESRKGLVEACCPKDETGSVVANLDDMSSISDDSVKGGKPRNAKLTPHLGTDDTSPSFGVGTMSSLSEPANDGSDGKLGMADIMLSISPATELDLILSKPGTKVGSERGTKAETVDDKGSPGEGSNDGKKSRKSTASADSVAASLTMENLPPALSRVALSYRTNEWAKHLSAAEVPEPDSPQFQAQAEEVSPVDETPAPLDVAGLQQTAESAALPLAAPRSGSTMSSYEPNQGVSRSSSRGSLPGYPNVPLSGPPGPQPRDRSVTYRTMSGTLKARSSALLSQVIAEEGDGESSGPAPLTKDAVMRSMLPALLRELPTSTSIPNLYAPDVAYSSPQTLIGMRETMLRNKASYSYLVAPSAEVMPTIPSHPPSDAGSLHNFPGPSTPVIDMDDLPLSQRRTMIRQSSLNFSKPNSNNNRSSLEASASATPLTAATAATAETAVFDSHQPLRGSVVPSEAVRQAQLANFRTSVAADLRPPGLVTHAINAQVPPLTLTARQSAPMTSLRGTAAAAYGGEPLTGMDLQRSVMLGQKEAEAQRREAERVGVERSQREWDERMRSGVMMEAHRDALRRMQGGVKDL